MQILPLHFRAGHLFAEVNHELWLIDTGAPGSFGAATSLSLAGATFSLGTSLSGLTPATLSDFVGLPCAGLLGADVLGCFDHIINTVSGTITLSAESLSHDGQIVPLTTLAGVPIFAATIGGTDYRMFFDTGAQTSYFQDASLDNYPAAGTVSDFYPGLGSFSTDTWQVPVTLGGVPFTLRCGKLPAALGMALMAAGTVGIVGNEILGDRIVGYFPRRGLLVL